MWVGLLWIIGVYAAAAAFVHFVHTQVRDRPSHTRYYLLKTRNNQADIEWILRSLSWNTSLTGRQTRIGVWDQGSTDDTEGIARIYSPRSCAEIQWLPSSAAAEVWMKDRQMDQVIVVDMNRKEDAANLPLH